MSWFKRKQKPSVAKVETPIRSVENESGGIDEKAIDGSGQYVLDPATHVAEATERDSQPQTEQSETSNSTATANASSEEPAAQAAAMVVPSAESLQEAEVVAAKSMEPEKTAEGRFSKLKARLKRSHVEPADTDAAQVSGSDSDAGEDQPSKVGKLKSLTSRSAKPGEKPKFLAVPVRVVIGYLPEVTERDALEYAVGLAEKHFEQIGMSYFDAFKYGNGYAYEAHEGGSGKAYLPEIIRYFDSQGTFRPGEDVKAVIRTATRAVEVQRTREGLAAIILPERDETPPSDWLQPTANMQPAINKRTGFLVVGAALFTTGFIAMIFTSMLTRFQEYEPAPDPVVQRIDISQLPNQKWSQLTSIPSDKFVRALRYRNGQWETPELVSVAPAQPTVMPGSPPLPPSVSAPATSVTPGVVPPTPSVGTTQFPSSTNPGVSR